MQVKVGAAKRREQKLCIRTRGQPVERLERDRLQGHGADAAFGLSALQPVIAVRAPHIHDARNPVDVALFEGDPFPGS